MQKTMYGLKHSPRMWYKRLRDFLVEIGFPRMLYRPVTVHLQKDNNRVFLFIYVDNIVITGPNQLLVEHLIKKMAKKFSLRELGDLQYCLGIQVKQFKEGLHLTQQ